LEILRKYSVILSVSMYFYIIGNYIPEKTTSEL
jgi:hypothetical protein